MWFSGAAYLPDPPKQRALSQAELRAADAHIISLESATISDPFAMREPTVIYQMASWCGICARQSSLLKAYKEMPNALPIRAIAMDNHRQKLVPKAALWAMPDYTETTYQLRKPDYDAYGYMLQSYGCTPVSGVPAFYFIHPDGRCLAQEQGPMLPKRLARWHALVK